MTMEPAHVGRGRPRASSHAAIERVALELMQRDGYDAVTVDRIVAAAGIARTTFFRYFRSKADVVWRSFDVLLDSLREELAGAQSASPLDDVRTAIVGSTRGAVLRSDAWLLRFKVFDRNPELHAESADRWRSWRETIAEFVGQRTGIPASAPAPMAIAGACYGVLLSVLRSWNAEESGEAFLRALDDALAPVCEALATLLDDRR
jgi:AcrR family transcriptional regulator